MDSIKASPPKPKVVRVIEPTINPVEEIKSSYRQLRVAAYCRVSTKQEEQLNSYSVQTRYYTEKINAEPKWTLVGIFADKGITGTSVKKRDEFNKMIRLCKRGNVDMIITKSISRFARNTVDCLQYIRMLKELNVDVYFEEQGIHSTSPGAEFYITIFGSIAQSESENISANVRWGKDQSAKEGKVPFHYKRFLGYRKGADGTPEIDPEEAEIIRRIYRQYLSGDSFIKIATDLNIDQIKTPSGAGQWFSGTVRSILSNEKYKGDAILNKTYISDCISKKVKVNNGERPKYYVENNHPAIIDAPTFARVQEEMARRAGIKKRKQVGTKTEQGRYSGKYALTDLLICGECGTPYRRCTWTIKGRKKVVWRCINRIDYGKKYCRHSPSVEESILQEAIMSAIAEVAMQNTDLFQTMKDQIGMGIQHSESHNRKQEIQDQFTKKLEIQVRLSEIDVEFNSLLREISSSTSLDNFDDTKMIALMQEKHDLEQELERYAVESNRQAADNSRLAEICEIMDGLKNRPIPYDDKTVRQLIDCVIVLSNEQIKVILKGGLQVTQSLI